MHKKFTNIIFYISVIVSAVLAFYLFLQRFANLSAGFSYDELYSLATALPSLPLSRIWNEFLIKDVNLPLYNILLYGWNHVFPLEPFYMRLFNTLASAAAVPLVWFLAPKSWPQYPRFTLAALTAGSFLLIAFGVNIRAYSFALLAAFAFTLLALRIIDAVMQRIYPPKSLWAGFFITGFLGSYLHYFCSAVFFIAALVVFLYACAYKTGRKTAFWGTAAVFALWLPWVINTYQIMASPHGSWWYVAPLARSTWDTITFLAGGAVMAGFWLVFFIVSGVSFVHEQKAGIFKCPAVILPLVQIILLVITVLILSLKYNLWLDRYFLLSVPPFLLLITQCLTHLQKRHAILVLLLPFILTVWTNQYWKLDYLRNPEYTGLKEAFHFVSNTLKAQKVLVDAAKTGYPSDSFPLMLQYYIPKESPLRIEILTPQNAQQAFEEPKIPVLLPLCSQIHMIQASLDYNMEEDHPPLIFGKDVCVFTVHPVPEKAK